MTYMNISTLVARNMPHRVYIWLHGVKQIIRVGTTIKNSVSMSPGEELILLCWVRQVYTTGVLTRGTNKIMMGSGCIVDPRLEPKHLTDGIELGTLSLELYPVDLQPNEWGGHPVDTNYAQRVSFTHRSQSQMCTHKMIDRIMTDEVAVTITDEYNGLIEHKFLHLKTGTYVDDAEAIKIVAGDKGEHKYYVSPDATIEINADPLPETATYRV